MAEEISAFFVYGTLKKNQLRGELWPRSPLSVFPALIQADLYDLGPYPAAVQGKDLVLGELWQFRIEHMPITIEVLDRIEGYESLGEHNEYIRTIAMAHVIDDASVRGISASVYFRAPGSRLESARRIDPWFDFSGKKVAAWPDAKARVPKSFAEE